MRSWRRLAVCFAAGWLLAPPGLLRAEKDGGKNDCRTPIIAGVVKGVPPPTCDDPPDDARILLAMPTTSRGVLKSNSDRWQDYEIVTELLIDKVDPPWFWTPVGRMQLHRCHWKCTVYYNEIIDLPPPFPCRISRPHVQQIYIDDDRLQFAE